MNVATTAGVEHLSPSTRRLFLFCRQAARHYGNLNRHALQHPVPTAEHAQQVLSALASETHTLGVEEDQFDVNFAKDFVLAHTSSSDADNLHESLFMSGESNDPRRQLDDQIADLLHEKAELERHG